MSEAYAVQRANLGALGDRPVGYKLGFTSRAMREQMNVPAPNYGVLTEGMRSAGSAESGALIHPRVEPEIALLTGAPLGADASPEDVRAALRLVYPALEVVDSRFAGYRFRLEDNTADNSSAAGFVLGEPLAPDLVPDLAAVRVTLLRDGETVDSGAGADALGGPLAALGWLARELGRVEGRPLEAGSLVLTGGLTRAHPTRRGSLFAAAFDGLGRAEVRFV